MKKIKITKRQIIIIVFLIIYTAVLFGINNFERTDITNETGKTYVKAKVVEVTCDNVIGDEIKTGAQSVKLLITSGEYEGQVVEAVSNPSYLYGTYCTEGMKVIAIISKADDSVSVSVYSYDRGNILYFIIIFFIVIICLIGGKKGLNSAIGLIFTLVSVIFIFIPLVYKGFSPIGAAVIIAILTTIVVMYLIDGISIKSICAVIGTIVGVIISAIFAWLFGKMTNISGYNVSNIESLVYIGQVTNIKIGELMFAGILISALGAVMDVAMSVASTVNEIYEHNKSLTTRELAIAGLNVGKDMMGTMSNTLILAFTGDSISTLILIYSYKYGYYQVINTYSIGMEIVQGISATLGVVMTVPIVALISAKALTVIKEPLKFKI